LKRQNNVGYFVGFAVPNQFHFALIIEQKETIFIGQGSVRFDEFEHFAFFIVGEFHWINPLNANSADAESPR
jgi:hypothetical protein